MGSSLARFANSKDTKSTILFSIVIAAVKSVEIARKYRNQPNANELIAREISANTTIRIPESWSRADHMFLDILDEVLDDEEALY